MACAAARASNDMHLYSRLSSTAGFRSAACQMRGQFGGKSTPAGENTAVSLKTYAKNQASAGSSSAAGAASSIAGPVSITLTDGRIKPALLAFSIAACLNLLVR